jgi:hypothetical protein
MSIFLHYPKVAWHTIDGTVEVLEFPAFELQGKAEL